MPVAAAESVAGIASDGQACDERAPGGRIVAGPRREYSVRAAGRPLFDFAEDVERLKSKQ